MTMTAAVGMAMLTAALGDAARVADTSRTVVVRIANESVVMEPANFAKANASQMFARIGVQIRWASGSSANLPPDAIIVDVVGQSSINECPGALACAKPFEGVHIRVFYDRLQRTVQASIVPALLAHVLVHEITHMLQGVDHHSPSGIMKARWDRDDYGRMRCKSLRFTEQDVILIERGLAGRHARMAMSVTPDARAGTL